MTPTSSAMYPEISRRQFQAISDRLQSRMNECYTKVEQQTLMLGRLHETCELARSVARLAGICKQLRQVNRNSGIKNFHRFH